MTDILCFRVGSTTPSPTAVTQPCAVCSHLVWVSHPRARELMRLVCMTCHLAANDGELPEVLGQLGTGRTTLTTVAREALGSYVGVALAPVLTGLVSTEGVLIAGDHCADLHDVEGMGIVMLLLALSERERRRVVLPLPRLLNP